MTQSINVTTDTLIKLFGSLDEYARLIEKGMGVVLRLQDGVLKIIGDDSAVERAAGLVNSLIALMGKGYEITRDKVLSSIDLALMDKPDDIISLATDAVAVTAKGKYAMAGEIAGYVSGENTVSDNYYTGSGKKSGREYTSWVPYQSKAKKVSSITFGNCSKLSSKYWTYSNKHKRLILKNNKEV